MNPFTEKAAVRLKAVNPLVADEDNVVRQRSTVHRNRQQQSRKSVVERFYWPFALIICNCLSFYTKDRDPGQYHARMTQSKKRLSSREPALRSPPIEACPENVLFRAPVWGHPAMHLHGISPEDLYA